MYDDERGSLPRDKYLEVRGARTDDDGVHKVNLPLLDLGLRSAKKRRKCQWHAGHWRTRPM